ncbi:hypothetical protein [Humibacter sp.]|uniref:hypothetical protein n=1 Tax=Humibacter sp. TaxID=1940291 RepID=UPI002BC31089|nr:hypothetical protein [Humibacter sp.]HVX09321.1 hypothetical protein [Humibacter sp.]
MTDQTPTTPNRATRRRRLARNGVVATGLAGGMTAIGFVAFGPGAATASPGRAPQAAPAPAAAPAAPSPLTKAQAIKKAAAKKDAAAPVAAPTAEDTALDAYFSAGYDYDDAVALQKMWNESDPFQTKVDAGNKLLAGEQLPIAPGSAAPAPAEAGDDAVSAYFNAGYDYDDAVQLAKMWHLATPYDAKVAGGKKLQQGETLPIEP